MGIALWTGFSERFKRLRTYFGHDRAVDITADRITAYAKARIAEGAAAATVKNELAGLKRGFSLAIRAGRLHRPPAFPSYDWTTPAKAPSRTPTSMLYALSCRTTFSR
jgi:hypothetical protein